MSQHSGGTDLEKDPEDGARARLQAIYQRARVSLIDSTAVIAAAVAELTDGVLSEPRRREAEHAAHRLAGTAGTVGFPEVTEVARELEAVFARGPRPGEAPLLATHAAALSEILSSADSTAAADAGPSPSRLLAVHTAQSLADGITDAASSSDLGVTMDRVGAQVEAAIVDLAHPDGPALIRGYADRGPRVPVLALVEGTSLDDRLGAANSGASLVLPRTTSAADIVAEAALLAEHQRQERPRILAVDDDPTILAILPAALAGELVDVTTLGDPREFWSTLEQTMPDLLILDLEMPHVDGIELCRVIRTDPRWSTLPVLFLTVHTDPATVDVVFAAGADDYVAKPLVVTELCARVRNRLDRVALSRWFADTDPLTGLANRRRLETDFGRLCSLARRHDQPLTLALLDIDHLKRVNDTHGHAVGDLALRRVADRLTRDFRGEDVVARWGGEEFVVVSVGLASHSAATRLTSILDTIRGTPVDIPDRPHAPLTVSFSAGVAELGVDGEDLTALTRSADTALYRAKRAGRARVIPASQRNPPGSTPRRTAARPPAPNPAPDADIRAYYMRRWSRMSG